MIYSAVSSPLETPREGNDTPGFSADHLRATPHTHSASDLHSQLTNGSVAKPALHKRTSSAPNPHQRTPSATATPLPDPIGFAFSHPPGLGAPEVRFSAQVQNPWKRNPDEDGLPPDTGAAGDDVVDLTACVADPETGVRRFRVMDDPTNIKLFKGNAVCTTKYTPLTFIMLNLYDQFHRLANFYFLFITILQLLPVSSTRPTTWLPLSIVILTNMVKEGWEDLRRHWMDEELNCRSVQSVGPGGHLMPTQWKRVRVGQVILVEEDEALPADVVVFATSDDGGLAYIETSQLDGETNLKHRDSVQAVHQSLLAYGIAPGATLRLTSVGSSLLERVWVEVEQPNDRLHRFQGTLHIGQHKAPVSNKQTMYRGCYLRNTKWILGLVVYTGMDTKLMRNAMDKRFKTTSLDKLTNKYVGGLFWFLGSLCLFSGALSGIFIAADGQAPFYVNNLGSWWLDGLILNTLTFVILYSNIVPIALTVTSEIVKTIHAYFVNCDLAMCYNDVSTGIVTPAQARTSNLGEDLGRVAYVFSDKTGTLTRNVMEYMKCSIAGVRYGTGLTEIGAAAQAAGRADLFSSDADGDAEDAEVFAPDMVARPTSINLEGGNNFWDPRISDGAWQRLPPKDRALVERFHLHLAICHTLLAKVPSPELEWTPANVQYQASSPDELALVIGAKAQGFFFKNRVGSQVQVEVADELRVFEILNVCEFNSTRKRMSCVVRMPDGRLILLCKGADNVICSLLSFSERHAPLTERTQRHLQAFANEGLRTLVLAARELDPALYGSWNARYVAALTAAEDRDERLNDVAVEIEVDLRLLGATAIEDKLQEGVPQALANLLRANIKVWMLTGDKVETAINIALACNLIQQQMHVEKVVADENEGKPTDAAVLRAQLLAAQEALAIRDVALVVDGLALESLLEDEMQVGMGELGLFLQVATRCRAVVCCRVSPKQKADVVHIVRKKQHVITVAIGDGANDVPMILNANIGIGISGKEGMQAVMASDYAVAQFAYLQRLILVHGRWSCQRICALILYFFYKNFALALLCFWYGFQTQFSGADFMDDTYGVMWNCLFTAFPIFCTAMFNKDFTHQAVILFYPELYKEVQGGQDLTPARFWCWIADSVWVSLVVFYIPLFALDTISPWANGQDNDWAVLFLTVYWNLHLVANLRLALLTRTWTAAATILMAFSIMSFFLFSCLYVVVLPISLQGFTYGAVWRTFACAPFWLCSALCCVVALLPPFVQMAFHKIFFPSVTQLLAEKEAAIIRSLRLRRIIVSEQAVLNALQSREPHTIASPHASHFTGLIDNPDL